MKNDLFKNMFVIICSFVTISYLMGQPTFHLERFATGLKRPVSIDHAGDSRLFVVEKNGWIRIVDSLGQVYPDPFLDISDRVRVGGNEMGFLGLAFHPDYKNNGYFYVNYTSLSPRRTIISRFSRDPSDPNHALANSEKILLVIEQPYSNHNGGCIRFGPDGYLYIGMGDGGSANDPQNRGQNPKELLAKMLRIDVDHGDPYGIPPDNPFVGDTSYRPEIWAMGVRNPWRFSFDRMTGDLYIADVGQNKIEEIDFQPAGAGGGVNYGWRCYEGSNPFRTRGCGDISNYVFPIHEYRHASGNCSITGGYVYRGTKYPDLKGLYFYADYCSGYIGALKRRKDSTWLNYDLGFYNGYSYASFGENNVGELFIAGIEGNIYQITGDTIGVNTTNLTPRQWAEISPNPTGGDVWLSLDLHWSGEQVTLTLIDQQGTVRYTDLMRAKHQKRIPMSSLSSGVYWLKVVRPDAQQILRIVKLEK